jgi:hypothetical protein
MKKQSEEGSYESGGNETHIYIGFQIILTELNDGLSKLPA